MYKVKEFKDIAGVGLAHQLLDREGRKPVSDKDIHSLAPVKKTEGDKDGKDDKKGDDGAKTESGAAPAAASGDGGDSGAGGGGGDDSAADTETGDGGSAEDSGEADVDDGDGEVKARPVSVAHQTQCCGGLKSGVCTLI